MGNIGSGVAPCAARRVAPLGANVVDAEIVPRPFGDRCCLPCATCSAELKFLVKRPDRDMVPRRFAGLHEDVSLVSVLSTCLIARNRTDSMCDVVPANDGR